MEDISWEEIESASLCLTDYEAKKPTKCGICGRKTKRLRKRPAGKVTFYICKYCYQMMDNNAEAK